MIVREAEIEDLERTMQVLDAGRQHMRGEGNAAQWTNGYPSPELIRRDIEQGQFFVWIDEAEEQTDRQQAIHGVFSFIIGEDPTYGYIENGSYLRLSTLTLSYNFGKLGDWVNSLRVYATCNNVFTLTGYKGTDPEISLGGTAPGIDARHSRYPRTRTFMFGLNVNF